MYGKEPNCRRARRRWPAARAARSLTAAGALAAALLATAGAVPATAVAVPATAGAMPATAGAMLPTTRHAAGRTSLARPARHAFDADAAGAAAKWVRIAAGDQFTCGIREGNTLWCWGSGASGALGTGQAADGNRPQQITRPTAGWASVTAGFDHGCATRTDGNLWCWGDNVDGELGIGTTTSAGRPHQVTTPAADGWTSVSAGGFHTCATRSDATLWCWGYNFNGQLGTGSSTDQNRPHQVTTPAADGWTSVSAGRFHTCATRSDATLWCWGNNTDGQLGTGSSDDSQDQPQQVTIPAAVGWTSVAAGDAHTCATRTHALWCWGSNDSGQLGIGGTTSQDLPRRVSLPTRTGWSLMAAGGFHTCATHTGHTLWCWGANSSGQLGIGSSTDQHRPQQVTS